MKTSTTAKTATITNSTQLKTNKELRQDQSLAPVIRLLETWFDRLNKEMFRGELPNVILTVTPDTTKGAYGWFTTSECWHDTKNDVSLHEINICSDTLNRPANETIGTLLHEMVHLYNWIKNKKDVSRNGYFHNDQFKETAVTHGLDVERSEKHGWSITKLTANMVKWCEGFKDFKAFELYRDPNPKRIASKPKAKSYKYVCPCCGAIVRTTKQMNIICGDCNVAFELED